LCVEDVSAPDTPKVSIFHLAFQFSIFIMFGNCFCIFDEVLYFQNEFAVFNRFMNPVSFFVPQGEQSRSSAVAHALSASGDLDPVKIL
jgi:hypothetical protein